MNTILLRHVNIVDSAEGVRREKNVLIEDGKIKSIFGNSETFPEAERILDLDGKYLAPGLIDVHSVAAESDALSAQRKKSHDVGLYHFEKLRPYHLLHA